MNVCMYVQSKHINRMHRTISECGPNTASKEAQCTPVSHTYAPNMRIRIKSGDFIMTYFFGNY